MSNTRGFDVIDAMVDELNAIAGTTLPEAELGPWIPGIALDTARIGVYRAREENRLPQGRLSSIAHRGLRVGVQCVVPTESVGEGESAVDPLIKHVIKTLSFSNLDGLATDIEEEGQEFDRYKADVIYTVATIFLRVNYQTARGDATVEA